MQRYSVRLLVGVTLLLALSVVLLWEPGLSTLLAPTSDDYFLHSASSDVLDHTSPTASTAQFKDSPSITRTAFKEIGTWYAAPVDTAVTLAALRELHVWLGLKNSDDQGTFFDLRAELWKNNKNVKTVIAAGETKNIQGVTRNPSQAKVVTVAFGHISDDQYTPGDILSLKILTKVADSGGHSNAVGVRLYYDAQSRSSRFGATSIDIEAGNTRPVANAGPDQTVVVGTTVQLDGSKSSDLDGDGLTFRWTLLSRPADSTATLSDASLVHPTFVVDRRGTYVVQLIVNDGALESTPDTVSITTENSRPVANAGPDQPVVVGATVQLNGSKSSDVDGDGLTWHWMLLSRPVSSLATLSNPTLVNPTFAVDRAGTYIVQLIVNDGTLESLPDTVSLTTENSRPVANAGPDQPALVGTTVQLDGSESRDADGDALMYQWSLSAKPAGSTAALSDASAVKPAFRVDLHGDYVAQLIVNDGHVDSLPDTVTVSTENSKPVAQAGSDQTVLVTDLVHLDGSGSSDADGDSVSYQWSLTSIPDGSTATLSNPTAVQPTFVADRFGTYIGQLIVNDGIVDSAPDTVMITVGETQPPQLHLDPPDGALLTTATPLLTITYQDEASGVDLASLQVSLDGVEVTARFTVTAAQASYRATLADGPHRLEARLQDQAGNAAQATSQLTIDTVSPAAVNQVLLTVEPITNGQVTVSGAAGSVEPSAQVRLTNTRTGQVVTVSATASGGFTATFMAQSGDSVAITVVDAAGNTSTPTTATVSGTLPPDPATVAPPVDRSVTTDLGTATTFLYTGSNAIQTGVAPGTIEARRVAVLRGVVLDRSNAPLAGVTVTALNHPEFGQTMSRADGMFDLAVNGGGTLTLNYAKQGYLPAQRQVNASWQDYVLMPDVVLIPVDPRVTTIDLTASVALQVTRGSVMTDADGSRQATLLFPQGTQAQMVMADGSTQPISTLSVRVTEFTVGPNGPNAMPAALPPTSGYTYAFVLTADEAKAAGATDVRFASPLPFYVENFLNFPVGIAVPLGAYDPSQGTWVASDNGRVVKIVSITGGLADLDTDGDDAVDNGIALGITPAERQQLASLYSAGQSLWRVMIPHFDQPWDCNWPYGPPVDAQTSNGGSPGQNTPPVPKPPCRVRGSIISCETQTLGEAVPVTGTPFRLHYQSDQVPGRQDAYTLEIPLSGTSVPASLRRIELEVSVAGQRLTQSFPAAPNQTTTFSWNGQDVYGRLLQGVQPITIRIGYVYGAVYQEPVLLAANFAALSGIPLSGSRARQEITLWQNWRGAIGVWDARAQGLGGWSLNVHHAYDLVGRDLYLGDGTKRSAQVLRIITTVAGNGSTGFGGDGGPATQAQVQGPTGVAVGPDGSLYIVSGDVVANSIGGHRVRRVDPNGIITTVAGTGTGGFSGDGGPATQAQLYTPYGVAIGPDGSLFIADTGNSRIRRVRPDGIITTVAGNGTTGFDGDGGPATQAQLTIPYGVALGPDGGVYIADFGSNIRSDFRTSRIRRVGPDGSITTVAGGGSIIPFATGVLAAQARLFGPVGVAVRPDGSIYIADNDSRRILRVGADGILTVVAGNLNPGFSGDGGPAIQAEINGPSGVAVGPDGSIYIGDTGNNRVRRVGSDGIITTVAGNGIQGFSGDGGPATQASLFSPFHVAVGPDSSLFFVDSSNNRIRRVDLPLPGLSVDENIIAAEDSSEIYIFSSVGRHLRTLHALTGAVLSQFTYDSAGLLTVVTDGDGNVTTIERNASSTPATIVGPFGQRTTLTVDSNEYLASLTNPAGEATRMSYTAGGLLTRFTDPRGNVSQMTYDAQGRLLRDDDAAGGFQTLARTEFTNGYEVTRTTALNRATRYRVERLTTGDQRRVNTSPDDTQTQVQIGTNGSRITTLPDGTVTTLLEGPDPRFAMQAPLPKSVTTATGGLTSTMTTERTVSLTDPNNPLSLTAFTDTVRINGRTYTSSYAAGTKTLTNTTPEGRQSLATIDNLGHLVQGQVAGLLPTGYTYDTRGRLATITQGAGPDERTATFIYNSAGFLETMTDPLGRAVTFSYDAAGRIIRQTLPDDRIIQYSYDTNGNLTSVTPPGRPAHVFVYTPVDLQQTYTPPSVSSGGTNQTLYTYNTDQQLERITRPDGQIVSFNYDNAGRLSVLTLPSSQIGYTYNATTGQLTSITSTDGGTLSYSYNGALLTQTTWAGEVAGSVNRSYDNDFRVTTLRVNGGTPITFQYDNDSLLTHAGDLTLSHNSQNGLITGTALGNVTDTLGYNNFGELASYASAYSGTALYTVQYTRDTLGRISEKTETISGVTDTFTYGYDVAGRLTSVEKNGTILATYTYDANGNRLTGPGLSTPPTYDDQDRLTQYGLTTYSYTANGELQSKTLGSQTTTYAYDVLGNLNNVTLPNGTSIAYVIGGNNRRIGKKMNGTLVQGFLYQNGLNPVAELDGADNVVARFVYASRANVPDYMVKGGVTYRIIADHLGSPRLVVDVATGSIVQRMDYDEFGNVTLDTNPDFQPFGFAGSMYDRNTRVTRFGARDYDAETGRWTAKEPILFKGGDTNLYRYTRNDPVNHVDAYGLFPIGPINIGNFFSNLFGNMLNNQQQGRNRQQQGRNRQRRETPRCPPPDEIIPKKSQETDTFESDNLLGIPKDNIQNIAIGIGLVAIGIGAETLGGGLAAVTVADDVTGVGVADDVLLVPEAGLITIGEGARQRGAALVGSNVVSILERQALKKAVGF